MESYKLFWKKYLVNFQIQSESVDFILLTKKKKKKKYCTKVNNLVFSIKPNHQ